VPVLGQVRFGTEGTAPHSQTTHGGSPASTWGASTETNLQVHSPHLEAQNATPREGAVNGRLSAASEKRDAVVHVVWITHAGIDRVTLTDTGDGEAMRADWCKTSGPEPSPWKSPRVGRAVGR
jgi:hypothetical protein